MIGLGCRCWAVLLARVPSSSVALSLILLTCAPACTKSDPDGAKPAASAGASKPATTPTVAPSTGEEPTTAAPEASPEPPAAKTPAIVYFVGDALWQVDADGTNKRALGLELSAAGPDFGGTIGHGDSTPTVSPDGRWIAWADELDLWVADLGGASPSKTQITKMPPRKDDWIVAAEIAFSTWSPDSSALVVMLREPSYMDEAPLPLPTGVGYGFHVLRSGSPTLTVAPQIEGVYAWTPDSKRVLDNKHIAQANYELRAYPIDGGPAEVLRTSTDGYGFSQLDTAGDWITWVANVSRDGSDGSDSSSQIMVAAIAGGEARPMSSAERFAEVAWPAVAPDGAHVRFEWKGKTHVSSGADESAAKPMPIARPRWYDASRLVGVGREGLALIELDGNMTVLDPAGTGLAR